jgi:hypothetical protein
MDALTLTFAMLLSLTVGIAGARGALGVLLYLLEAGYAVPNRPSPVVPATAPAANPTSHS